MSIYAAAYRHSSSNVYICSCIFVPRLNMQLHIRTGSIYAGSIYAAAYLDAVRICSCIYRHWNSSVRIWSCIFRHSFRKLSISRGGRALSDWQKGAKIVPGHPKIFRCPFLADSDPPGSYLSNGTKFVLKYFSANEIIILGLGFPTTNEWTR